MKVAFNEPPPKPYPLKPQLLLAQCRVAVWEAALAPGCEVGEVERVVVRCRAGGWAGCVLTT